MSKEVGTAAIVIVPVMNEDQLTVEVTVKDMDLDKTYDFIKENVGGIIDCVRLDSMNVDMWLHDEGKLIGLTPNPFATVLYFNEFDIMDFIAGPVVLTKGPDHGGKTTGFTQEELSEFQTTLEELMNKFAEQYN